MEGATEERLVATWSLMGTLGRITDSVVSCDERSLNNTVVCWSCSVLLSPDESAGPEGPCSGS